MELLIHLFTQPAGLAAGGLLAVVGAILHWRSKQFAKIRAAYASLGFSSLKQSKLHYSMNIGEYQLLRNASLAFFLYNKPFGGAANGRRIVQCLRTKFSLYEKHYRYTTVTQCDTTIPLPAFCLKPALKFDFYLTNKPRNLITNTALEVFSETFELSGIDISGVQALFNAELCQTFLSDPHIEIECTGDKLIVLHTGKRILNASEVDKFVQDAITWTELLETAQITSDSQMPEQKLKAA